MATAARTVFAIPDVVENNDKAEADLLVTPSPATRLPACRCSDRAPTPTRDVETAAKPGDDDPRRDAWKEPASPERHLRTCSKEVTAVAVASTTSWWSRWRGQPGRRCATSPTCFLNQAVAEQTDKLHREIASQFQGLKAWLTAPEPPPTLERWPSFRPSAPVRIRPCGSRPSPTCPRMPPVPSASTPPVASWPAPVGIVALFASRSSTRGSGARSSSDA